MGINAANFKNKTTTEHINIKLYPRRYKMSWISDWKQKIEDYIVKKGMVKAATAVAIFIISKLGTAKVQAILEAAGVHVDPTQLQVYVTGLAIAGLTFIWNFIKQMIAKKSSA